VRRFAARAGCSDHRADKLCGDRYNSVVSRARQQCTHLNAVKAVAPTGAGCEDCLAMGAHKHPIISSFERGEDWSWCFIDEIEVFVT
jgi:hypothetical protein